MIIKIFNHFGKINTVLKSRIFFTTMQKLNISQQGKTIIHQGNKQLLVEGKAKIFTKYIQKNAQNQLVENEVFYNPVQIFNRDFTILVMQAYINLLKEQSNFYNIKEQQKFKNVNIIDALSASGLRTIRFLKQLSDINIIYANDISPASHKLMKDNFELNKLDQTKYKQTLQDANLVLINSKKDIQFDIVDLDPYGSVVPFLDAAVDSVKDGGLLCITCTDNKVTAGPDISKCFYYYGTTRAKVHHFNENALRIVLSTVSSAASRHCKYIEPMISFQTDFYLRVFVRVYRGKKQCAQSGTKIGNVYNCNSCGNYQYSSYLTQKKQAQFVPRRLFLGQTNCSVCQQPYYLNGPIWLDNMNNLQFAKRLIQMMQDKNFNMELKTHKKIYGTLVSIVQQGELSKIPLGFNFDKMCKTIRSTCPSKNTLLSGIQSLQKQFRVVPSYVSPGFYKTNAPIQAIYDLIKSWKKKDMGEDKYISPAIKQQFSVRILKNPIEYVPDFEFKSQTKIKKVPHFIKMGKNMGPKGKPMSRVIGQQQAERMKQQLKQ